HALSLLVLFMLLRPPLSTLFPYTTLFRSRNLLTILRHAGLPAERQMSAGLDAHDLDVERDIAVPLLLRRHLRIHFRRYNRRLNRSEEHTSELQSRENLVCRLLLEKKKKKH